MLQRVSSRVFDERRQDKWRIKPSLNSRLLEGPAAAVCIRRLQLTNDAAGRRDLQVMLDIGLTGPEAMNLAPWLTGAELEQMEKMCPVSGGWNGRSLGAYFKVTLDEQMQLPWGAIRKCHNTSNDEIKRAKQQRRKERDNAYARVVAIALKTNGGDR